MIEGGADLLTLAFAAGGAWAGVRFEVRKLRERVDGLYRVVKACPHHDEYKPQTKGSN